MAAGALLAALAIIPGQPSFLTSGQFAADFGFEHDSNPERTLIGQGGVFDFVETGPRNPDQLLSATLSFRGQGESQDRAHRIGLSMLAGGKRFMNRSSEDLLGLQLGLATRHRWGQFELRPLTGFQAGHVRQGSRDFQHWRLGLDSTLWVDQTALGLTVQFHRYQFLPEPRLSFDSPQVLATVTLPLASFLDGVLMGGLRWRLYDGNAVVPGEDPATSQVGLTFCDGTDSLTDCSSRRREDTEPLVGARFIVKGSLYADLGYLFRPQLSSAQIERLERHQIEGSISFRLPWAVIASAQATLLISTGSSRSEQLVIRDDSENQSSLQLQLERPLFGRVSLQIRYAFFASQFGESSVEYERHTLYSGLRIDTQL